MDCGADLGFVVDTFPLAQALPMIFRGTGDCSIVLWRFAGLSIAEWALVCFATILLIEVWRITKKS
jgi:disulfide bond formation protein DsbB